MPRIAIDIGLPTTRGGGFRPTQLSGLVLWLRADLGITLNGGNVSDWADQSGNGNHVTQGTAANQPLYVTSDSNFQGQPTVQYDGTNDSLGNTTMSLDDPCTFAMCVRLNSTSTYRPLTDTNPATDDRLMRWEADTFQRATVYSGTHNYSANNSWLAGEKKRFQGVFDGANSVNRLNGVEVVGNAGTVTTTAGIWVGARPPTFFWSGEIAEFIAYNRALNAAERAQLDSYFLTRYGG